MLTVSDSLSTSAGTTIAMKENVQTSTETFIVIPMETSSSTTTLPIHTGDNSIVFMAAFGIIILVAVGSFLLGRYRFAARKK